MDEITAEKVSAAIHNFLKEQLEKKLGPKQKTLDKCKPEDAEKRALIQEDITALKHEYTLSVWMKDAATRMASKLKFGTHISKGIHPKSDGDNVSFRRASSLPKGIVGSQTLSNLSHDANRDAKLLPLAEFLDTWVSESSGIKISDLVLADSPVLDSVFSSDTEISKQYAAAFKKALENPINNPKTDGCNKQILWPLEGAMANDQYMTLVPLYPSSFTHDFFYRVNSVRYSEENKLAKDNRKKKNVEQAAYKAIPDIAVLKLGGGNSQNVGRLTVKKSGRNYLLQSLPPQIGSGRSYRLNKEQESLFSRRLNQYSYFGLKTLFGVVRNEKKNLQQRDTRKHGLEIILAEVLKAAAQIQQTYSSGWSRDYQLSMAEKYWLDPKRGELEGEEAFLLAREKSDWQQEIIESFAHWLNTALRGEFPKRAAEFGDAEFGEWKRAMEFAIGASQRAKEGVFA
ncbi:MAG: hypothetical protein AXW15_12315 [Neptuniibacter sp. Phe_28]|jgi:CRISPR-associated protein Csy1|nr:MAG: hypothetical protein AXW15_12315 [Neptuniibacter sp. Phe_28]